MSIRFHFHRKPDMEFDGLLRPPGEQSGVLCDCQIWLAKDASEDSWVEISVSSSDTSIWVGPGPLVLSGKLGDEREVQISGIWMKSVPAGSYPPRLTGRRQFGLAHIDRITERYSFKQNQSGQSLNYALSFDLTDTKYLNPSKAVESNCSGDVSVRTPRRFEVLYPPLGKIIFDRSYQTYTRDDVSGDVRTSSLIAQIDDVGEGHIKDVKVTESLMSDVCLLASLAARHRVLILGTAYATPNERCRSSDTPLKRHRPSPQDEFWGGLIDRRDFENYFLVVAEKFCAMTEKDKARIREAIYPLVPVFPFDGVESEFLALFSAFEALVRIGQVETIGGPTIVDADRWKIVKREVRKAINSLGAEFSDDERDSMRQKIGELNRPSAKAAISRFLDRFSVPIDDLWPIFGSREMPGLAEIRNRLAHGDAPSNEAIGALGIAKHHLGLLLERSLLSALGHDVERSRASVSRLSQVTITDRQRIEQFRRALSDDTDTPEDGRPNVNLPPSG